EAELPTVAETEARRTALDELRDAEAIRIQRELLPGDVNRVESIRRRGEVAQRRLVLLPVWISTHRHGDEVLRLLVNGQTGKVIGRVPIDKRKLALLIGGLVVLIGLLALLIKWRGA